MTQIEELESALDVCECKAEAFELLRELQGLYRAKIHMLETYLSICQRREVDCRLNTDVEY